MPAASKNGFDPKACLDQVDRLANSPFLHGSEALCHLIRFLAEHTLNAPSEHLKEYQIATEVLGRPAGFDPNSDASVRVQVTRLRVKLAEYYSSIGSHDPIVVEIPKGRYELSFRNRPLLPEDASSTERISASTSKTPVARHRLRAGAMASLTFLAGILITFGVLIPLLGRRQAPSHNLATSRVAKPQTALEVFWGSFVRAPEGPFVVFRNLTFVGEDATGMRRFDPSRDNPHQAIQGFTGVGEVMGILELAQLFDKFGSRLRVKREDLFTIDDARHSDLIVVGSPGTALSIREIPGTQEFTFRRQDFGPSRFRWAIIDHHPRSGAKDLYPGASQIDPVVNDYAIVALKRGLDPSHWTLFLEGTSTEASQAAVDFVCSEDSVAALLDRLHIANGAHLKAFEGLLRIKVANGVPVETELLDLRETKD